jgi:starch-binding outer membrane protein SusE/F
MKNTFKIIIAAIVFATLGSCSDEQNYELAEKKGTFSILTPQTGASTVLTPALGTNPALTMTWSKADFTTPTQVDYTVEIAVTGTSFAAITPAGTTNTTNLTWSVADLNGAVLSAGLRPFTQGSIDIRVKAAVGSVIQYSNTINVLVTPYTTALPTIAVPGNHQNWSPGTAPKLASAGYGQTNYEGYVWLDGGFKFVAPDNAGNFNWGNDDWGDDGTFTNKLVLTNEVNCNAATAGYYRLRANTALLTYSQERTTWAIIGNATPGGWSTDTPMIYNPTTKKWTVTVTLTAQSAPDNGLKFRANGGWDLNYGDTGADGKLEEGGTNISTTAGTKTITLDLSNPRVYTYTIQ